MIRPTRYRTLLADTRLTLAELHRLTGVSPNTLRSLSSGRNTNPRLTTRRKLAAALRSHSRALEAIADELAPPE